MSRRDSQVYLDAYLAPLAPFLARDDVTDIYVNAPGTVWLETLGGRIEDIDLPALDERLIGRLAHQIAAISHQAVSPQSPLLSATLPAGHRVQIVMPPATRESVVIAIRKHVASTLSLDDYGGLSEATADGRSVVRREVARLAQIGDRVAALRLAVKQRLNFLISGGTSSGKTTFLSSLLDAIPAHERLVLIEDTPELRLSRENAVGLVAARGEAREARVDANDLVTAALRLRPDRIILGELRGLEAFAFLRAVNTGHPGSMTTVHANDANGAIEQIVLLALQSSSTLERATIVDYVRTTIDVYVHMTNIGGRRLIDHVHVSSTG